MVMESLPWAAPTVAAIASAAVMSGSDRDKRPSSLSVLMHLTQVTLRGQGSLNGNENAGLAWFQAHWLAATAP